MGDCGLAHKFGTLFSRADNFHSRGILQVIHKRDCPIAWNASLYSIEPGSQVYNSFEESFQRPLRTQMMMSTAFHPQIDDLLEMTIQTFKDMMRACVLDLKGS